jgi:hypothetical protein
VIGVGCLVQFLEQRLVGCCCALAQGVVPEVQHEAAQCLVDEPHHGVTAGTARVRQRGQLKVRRRAQTHRMVLVHTLRSNDGWCGVAGATADTAVAGTRQLQLKAPAVRHSWQLAGDTSAA